jgi:hypothetical protein
MTSIFYLFIALPMIFLIMLLIVFQASVAEIGRQQLRLNCPYPVNSGIATLTPLQSPPQVNYTITYDNDTSNYHVTIFKCGETAPTSVSTIVYTADTGNQWFDITSRASGYMFYISQSITEFFNKVNAGATMLYLTLTAPAQVSGVVWFNYAEVLMFSFIGLGIFMIARG